MTPYIILIIYMFVARGFSLYFINNKSRQNTVFIGLAFLYLYIFCAIRSFTVGIDIPGYIKVYELTNYIKWSDWEYVYFENGYIFLMKLCVMLGLSARAFFYVIYAIMFIPVYILIRKYSPYPFISVILFICFQYLGFDMTGVRQGIGMSLCIIAFIFATKAGMKNFLLYALFIWMAVMVHRSSFVFAPAYFIMRLPIKKKYVFYYCAAAVICAVINVMAVGRILTYFENEHYHYVEEQQLGLTLLLIILFSIGAVLAAFKHKKPKTDNSIYKYVANMMMSSVCLLLLTNGSILLRASMYYYLYMVLAIPFFLKSIDKHTRNIAMYLIIAIMLWHFFTGEITCFDLMPYKIG